MNLKLPITALLLLIVVVPGSAIPGPSRNRNVDIRAADGATLKGSYFAPAVPGPGLLLLHQCSRDRHAWDNLASEAVGRGIHVLTFDYRGFGETAGTLPPAPAAPRTDSKSKFGPTFSAGWIGNRDVEAAYQYLRRLPGVDQRRIAIGGASCGAGLAADLTIHHPEIRALLIMSGHISGGAAAHITATPWMAVLGVAEREDMPTVYEGVQAAVATSANPNSAMKMYPGRKHGVDMFDDNPELQSLVVRWLRRVLR